MLYTVAEVEPPDPAGKSSTLGTSQLWEWSHWIRGEMRGVPTGTGYLTAGYSCLLSILILQNKQEKNIYETIIAFIMFCNITKSVLTHSCRSCLCEKERTPSCWHVLSSTRAKWNKWAWGCASEWPGEEVRVIQFECCSKKKKNVSPVGLKNSLQSLSLTCSKACGAISTTTALSGMRLRPSWKSTGLTRLFTWYSAEE